MAPIQLPEIIFGTSGLGNLYVALPEDQKIKIISEILKCSATPVVFDTAGKYGAGLSLESLGKGLKVANANPEDVIISNKLGWLRTKLSEKEPAFEPGVWKDLRHDAVQRISYDGILECFEQGNDLLNGFKTSLVSVHDPDEYLFAANSVAERKSRYKDILHAYEALAELKSKGKVSAIGIGAKNWKVIQEISNDVALDWIMIANSMTIHSHPRDLTEFISQAGKKQISIINSAVFNGGFLTGLDYYNYKKVSVKTHPELYYWRESFYKICNQFDIRPEVACAVFAKKAPGISSIAVSTTNPQRVAKNAAILKENIPDIFWRSLANESLIDKQFAQEYLYKII